MAFRLGPFPVRIHLSFFLTSFLLSGAWDDATRLLLWVAIVFVSVLIHELGHAIAGRAFGLEPQIDLHGMGGTTSWKSGRDVSRGKSIVISGAGPAFGLIVGGALIALLAVGVVHAPEGTVAQTIVGMVLYVNVGWSLFNLMPMLPLDGGNILRALLRSAKQPIRGERAARIVSIVTAGIIAAIAIAAWKSWYIAILAGLFAYQNIQALSALSALENDAPLHDELAKAYDALARRDPESVLRTAEPIVKRAKSAAMVAEALQAMAFAYLMLGRIEEADAAMHRLPVGFKPHAEWLEARAKFGGANSN
jgi:Zn-dependent protease